MSDEPLSVGQAAKAVGVSTKTIRRAIERGDLRALRPGGGWRIVILEEDLAAWRDRPVVPRKRSQDVAQRPSRRPPERGSLAALREIERRAG